MVKFTIWAEFADSITRIEGAQGLSLFREKKQNRALVVQSKFGGIVENTFKTEHKITCKVIKYKYIKKRNSR